MPPPIPPRPRQKESTGPIIGASIVVILLIVGALYFGNARLNRHDTQPLPFITGDVSTTTAQ